MFTQTPTINPLAPFSEVPPRTFETERLHLRAVELSDVATLFHVYTGDPVATRYMFWPRANVPEDCLGFFEMVVASFAGEPMGGAHFVWIIQIKETGQCIGSCGIDASRERTACGGYILNPAFWGQGYATEAWRPVIEWTKTQPEVVLCTDDPSCP